MSETFEILPDEPAADVVSETTEQQAEAVDETVEESVTSEETEAEGEEKPRKQTARGRIDQLTREKYEEKIAREQAEARLRAMEQEMANSQTHPDIPMPRLADFDYDETRYGEAIREWHGKQLSAYQENLTKQQQQAMQQQAVLREQQELQAKIAEGSQKYHDFADKVNNPNLPPLRNVNPAAYQAMMESDSTVDIAYYLSNNPAEVYQFASMTPVQAIKEVARIEAKLAKKPMQAGQRPPAPPTTLKGNSEAAPNPQKMTTSEWMAWRTRQLQKSR